MENEKLLQIVDHCDIISSLIKLVGRNQKADFVQTILSDDHEINTLKQCAGHMKEACRLVVAELVGFTKVGNL